MNYETPLKVIMALSGGLDSATLLGYLLQQGHHVTCVSFNYGSKHNKYENEAARNIAGFYKVGFMELDIQQTMEHISSNLLKSGGEIPEGHYEAESMKLTVVPARNQIFLSILTGIAISQEADSLAIGVHSGDHAIYADCRPDFIAAMSLAAQIASDQVIQGILTPFIYLDKSQIVKIGHDLSKSVPYAFTRTCYKDQPVACGKCGSCNERIEAFKLLGKIDPVKYEIHIDWER